MSVQKAQKGLNYTVKLREAGSEQMIVDKLTANTATVQDVLTTKLESSGTAAANIGIGESWQIENAAGEVEERARIDVVQTTATDGSEAAEFQFKVASSGTVTKVATINSSGLVLNAGGTVDYSGQATTISLKDNTTDALAVKEASTSYITVDTNDSAEKVQIHQKLDMDNQVDMDSDVTAAGAGIDLLGRINHATGDYQGILVDARQLTTARSSGTVDGVKIAATSLAGDSGGTYNNVELTVTDGGGSATHNAIKVGAGFDALIDASACATGEADIVLKDNVAIGLQVREATNPYITCVTSDNSESVAIGKRLTTTDGVASGTVRVVGGLAYSNVAASSAVTSTATETLFDTSYTIPANTLKAGTVIKLRWQGICTATNGTDTFYHTVRIGGVAGSVIFTGTATDVANSDMFAGEAIVVIRTTGAGGTLVASSSGVKVAAASGTATRVDNLLASTAVDTTATQVVGVTGKWSTTDAGNSARVDIFTVEII